MAKKKAGEPSWDQIGKMIGKKVEKEFKSKECGPWKRWALYHHENHGGGFFGRLLFIIGVLIALNALGILEGVSVWAQILIGAGFALMRF